MAQVFNRKTIALHQNLKSNCPKIDAEPLQVRIVRAKLRSVVLGE